MVAIISDQLLVAEVGLLEAGVPQVGRLVGQDAFSLQPLDLAAMSPSRSATKSR
jgi:hypothetical protein